MEKQKEQFKKVIIYLQKSSADSKFTKDLYRLMHTRCNFIAHFDRKGFFKERFQTLNDFDHTLSVLKKTKIGQSLLENIDLIDIEKARYGIAKREASLLKKKAELYSHRAEKLQEQFSKEK